MAENPVTVDPNAYRVPVPQAARPADATPIAAGLERIGQAGFQLGQALYQQDQQDRVIRAQLYISGEMEQARLQAAHEPVLDNIIPTFKTTAEKIKAGALAFGADEHTRTAIEHEYDRARLTAEANIFPDVMKQRADVAQANILTLADRNARDAEVFPSIDLAHFKERVDQFADQLVLSGGATRSSATTWALNQKKALDFMKADQAVTGNPTLGLQQLRQRDSGEPGAAFSNYRNLEPEKRNVLIDRAMAGAKQKAVNVSLSVQQGVTSIMTGQSNADGQLAAITARGATQDQLAEARLEFDAAGLAKNSIDSFTVAGPEEQGRLIADFQQKALDPAYPERVRMLAEFAQQIGVVEHDWHTDPASAADRYFKLPKDAIMADRIAARKAAYVVKGLPFYSDPLSKAESANIIKTFTNMPQVDQKPAYARAIMGSFGSYGEEATKQLLRDKMPWGFVRLADPDLSPFASANLAAAISVPISDLRKRYGGDPTVATGLERDAIAKFNDGPAKSLPAGDPAQIAEQAQITAQLALQLGSAQQAYDLLWGMHKYAAVNGGETRIRIPAGVAPDMVTQQAERVLSDAISAGGAVVRPPLPGAPGETIRYDLLTDLPTTDMRQRELTAHGGWLTYSGPTGTDDGIVLTLYGRPAVDKNKREIRFTWRELQDYGAREQFDKAQKQLQTATGAR